MDQIAQFWRRDLLLESDHRPPPSWASKILKESGIGLGGALIGTALNYVVLITVTRFLDPQQFGTFALAQSIVAVSLVFVLCGTPRALDQFIPRYAAHGELGKARPLVAAVVRLAALLACVVGASLLLLSRRLAVGLFHNEDLIFVLRLMVLSIPALAWIELVASSFVGFKELRYRVYTHHLLLPVLKTVIALAVLSLGYGLGGWIFAHLAALFITSAVAWMFLRRRMRALSSPARPSGVKLGEVLAYSWPLSVNSLVVMLSGQLGVLMLGAFRPEAEVGVFRVYVYVIAVLVMIRTSFAQIYKPVASGLIAEGRLQEVRSLFGRVAKWTLITGSFSGLVILIVGDDILTFLLPESYLVAVASLFILASARMVMAALGPQDMTLEALGNTRLSMLNAIVMLGVNFGVGRLLIPSHGILGAATALAVAGMTAALLGSAQSFVLHRVGPFGPAYLRALSVIVLSGAVTWILDRAWPGAGILRTLGIVGALGVLFAVGLRISKALDSVDYAVLSKLFDKVMRVRSSGEGGSPRSDA